MLRFSRSSGEFQLTGHLVRASAATLAVGKLASAGNIHAHLPQRCTKKAIGMIGSEAGLLPPSAHTTVRAVPHTAVQHQQKRPSTSAFCIPMPVVDLTRFG